MINTNKNDNDNKFINIENTLKTILNSRLNYNQVEAFYLCLTEFKQIGFLISKEYLKNLIENKNKTEKSRRISKVLEAVKNKGFNIAVKPSYKYITEHKGFSTIKTKKVFNMLIV